MDTFLEKVFGACGGGGRGVGGRDKRGPPERVLTSIVGGRDKRGPPERVLTSAALPQGKIKTPIRRWGKDGIGTRANRGAVKR